MCILLLGTVNLIGATDLSKIDSHPIKLLFSYVLCLLFPQVRFFISLRIECLVELRESFHIDLSVGSKVLVKKFSHL